MQLLIPRRTLFGIGLIFVLLLFGAALFVYLPKAIITVRPEQNDRLVEQEIIISSSVDAPDFVRYRLPAQLIQAEASSSREFTRDSDTQFDDFAKGKVTLVNLQAEEQQLLPQTHLRHVESGVFFLTDTPVAIAPESEIGMTITAKEPGGSGNVPAGRFVIDKLAPSLQSRIYAESSTETAGGIAVEAPITETEWQAAREELLKDLRVEVSAQLSTQAGGAGIRDDLISIAEEDIQSTAEVGSKAISFVMTGHVVGKAFVVDDTDLLGLTVLKLREDAGSDEEFVTYDPKTFMTVLVRGDFEQGEAVIRGSVSGSFAARIGPKVFSGQNLAGLSDDEVREYLQAFPGVGDVEVALSPWWVKSIPTRPGATRIVVDSSVD